jgi:hypothetical protein
MFTSAESLQDFRLTGQIESPGISIVQERMGLPRDAPLAARSPFFLLGRHLEMCQRYEEREWMRRRRYQYWRLGKNKF